MQLGTYFDLAMRTCNNKGKDRLIHGVAQLTSEVQEFRDALAESGNILSGLETEHVKLEMGDILWSITEIAHYTAVYYQPIFNECEYHPCSIDKAVGKLNDIVQKSYQGHEPDREEIFDCLCECVHWIKLTAGDKLSEIMGMNIKKLEKRYPNGFEAERSLHRAEGDI